jgi:hypothetical protein
LMWIYVLYMGFGMAFDPFRVGFVLVLTSRPRPMMNLFAFWLGGMAAGIGEALVVLLLMRDFALVAIHNVASAFEDLRSGLVIFTGGRLQITLGVIILMSILVIRVRERARKQVAFGSGGVPGVVLKPRGPAAVFAWLAARTHDMLKSDYIWPVFVAGAASAIPPIEGVAVLAVIMASRADLGTQLSAFLVFTLLLLSIIEIPLVSYLVRPEKTLAVIQQIQGWIQAHLRQIMHGIMTMGGLSAVVQGVASL